MTWLDDGLRDDERVITLMEAPDGPAAFSLWVFCQCWASGQPRHAGKPQVVVPEPVAERMIGPAAAALLGLLADHDLLGRTPGGYVLTVSRHPLPLSEPPVAPAAPTAPAPAPGVPADLSAKRAAAGRRGAAARWGNRADGSPEATDGNLRQVAVGPDAPDGKAQLSAQNAVVGRQDLPSICHDGGDYRGGGCSLEDKKPQPTRGKPQPSAARRGRQTGKLPSGAGRGTPVIPVTPAPRVLDPAEIELIAAEVRAVRAEAAPGKPLWPLSEIREILSGPNSSGMTAEELRRMALAVASLPDTVSLKRMFYYRPEWATTGPGQSPPADPTPAPDRYTSRTGVPVDWTPAAGGPPAAASINWIKDDLARRFGARFTQPAESLAQAG